MNTDLYTSILDEMQISSYWSQKFVLSPSLNDGVELDLSVAIGTNPKTPFSASDQPKAYPSKTVYMFPTQFTGTDSWDDLFISHLKKSLPGSQFILIRGPRNMPDVIRRDIHCSHWLTAEEALKKKIFVSDSFIQTGVREESLKRKKCAGSLSTFDLMSSRSQLTTMKASRSSKNSGYSSNQPKNRRCTVNRASSTESRCYCKISIIYNKIDRYYYLDSKNSSLEHSGHQYVPPASTLLRSSAVSEDLNTLMNQMSCVGISSHQISSLMEVLDTQDGLYDNKMISNLIQKHTNLKYDELGITTEMTSAERAINYLNR